MGIPVITPSGVTRCEAITDIIASVALEQTALAHILNAEGEKIQKFTTTAATPTPEILLAINKSVKEMVTTITNLEIVLQFKLDLFSDCLCDECLLASEV